MASKNISIRLDLYNELVKLKEENESFSDLIERLLNEGLKGSASRLMKYFSAWEDLPEEFTQKIEEFRKSIDDNIDSRVQG